jgi:hypothetical protein
MQSHQETKSTSHHFLNGTLSLAGATIFSVGSSLLQRLNREESFFRQNNTDGSNAFLTLSVGLSGALAILLLTNSAVQYSRGLFKASPFARNNTNNQALDTDLEAPFTPQQNTR